MVIIHLIHVSYDDRPDFFSTINYPTENARDKFSRESALDTVLKWIVQFTPIVSHFSHLIIVSYAMSKTDSQPGQNSQNNFLACSRESLVSACLSL